MESIIVLFVLLVIVPVVGLFIVVGILESTKPSGTSNTGNTSRGSASISTSAENFTKQSNIKNTKRTGYNPMTGYKYGTDFFVYKYTFPDGKVYIGRSSSVSNRFGNPKSYEGQKVYT